MHSQPRICLGCKDSKAALASYSRVNRDPIIILPEIIGDGESDGLCQGYEGRPIEVQLIYHNMTFIYHGTGLC